jgi:Family of unknown function (DUF6152)
MTSRIATFIAIGLVLAGTALAHHNMSAIFDFNDRVTMTGTLKTLDWRNPHIELIVEAKDGNETVSWKIEGPSPSFFRTRDVTKADFEAALGKSVTAEASRARDGSRWGLLRTINLPGGKSVSACPQNC